MISVKETLENYGGEIPLAAVNYDKDAPAGVRYHTYTIEKVP